MLVWPAPPKSLPRIPVALPGEQANPSRGDNLCPRAGPRQAVRGGDNEINDINSSFAATEPILAIFCSQVPFVNLIVVKLSAEFECVGSEDSAEIIQHLVGIVVLASANLGHPDRVIVERHVGDAFQFRHDWADSSGSRPRCNKAQIGQAVISLNSPLSFG